MTFVMYVCVRAVLAVLSGIVLGAVLALVVYFQLQKHKATYEILDSTKVDNIISIVIIMIQKAMEVKGMKMRPINRDKGH